MIKVISMIGEGVKQELRKERAFLGSVRRKDNIPFHLEAAVRA